jgi:hypothetical protein
MHRHNEEIREMQGGFEKQQKRAVGEIVTATINGKIATWINEYDGSTTPTQEPAPKNVVDTFADAVGGGLGGSPSKSADSPTPSLNAGLGNWGRQGYYNAEKGIADGVTFLNHLGGDGSGVFD